MDDYKQVSDDREQFLFDELGFCGCGDPKAVAFWLRDLLETMTGPTETWDARYARRMELVGREAIGLFVLYQLDHMGLTEHGSSVNGSWLTPQGETILRKLKDYCAEFA